MHVYRQDADEITKRKFEEGVEKIRSYRITDGKAWDEGKRKVEITGNEETVLKGINKASARRTARCRARRVKQEFGKKKINLL